MILRAKWNDKLSFLAETDGHSVTMDAKPPLGADQGMTPKQLLLAAACGCTGMDVAALLRKFKQPLQAMEIEAEATVTEGKHPVVFTAIALTFKINGEIEAEKALEAVKLSQTKYCAVSAMLSKAVPISYTVVLNSVPVGTGRAQFTEGE